MQVMSSPTGNPIWCTLRTYHDVSESIKREIFRHQRGLTLVTEKRESRCKAASSKAICCQSACSVQRVGIHQEREDPRKDKDISTGGGVSGSLFLVRCISASPHSEHCTSNNRYYPMY